MGLLNISKNKKSNLFISKDSSTTFFISKDELRTNLKTGLLCALELDETSGTIAYDSNGIRDWVNTNCTIMQPGKLNYSYFFGDFLAGSLEYQNTLISNPLNISVSFWFKHNGTYDGTDPATIFMDGAETDNSIFQIMMLNNPDKGKIRFYLRDEDLEAAYIITTNAYDDNQWHFVSAIKKEKTIFLYVDEVLIGQDTRDYGIFDFTKAGINHYTKIGKTIDAVAAKQEYLGYLDQVCVWEIPLNADQRFKLYNRGNGKAFSNW